MANQYPAVYAGLVEDNRDPDRMGRLKVRVPIAYGQSSQISTPQLPWAIPRGLPSGGSQQSGGVDWIPEIGDQVWVTFLDGEPEKPLWEWSTQSRPQAKNFHLYKYDSNGKPLRAALTKHGHTIELNKTSIVLSTLNGNAILLDDGVNGALIRLNNDLQLSCQDIVAMISALQVSSEGQIFFETSQGFSIKATDLAVSVTEDLIQKVGRYTLLVGSALITVIDGAITLLDKSGSTVAMDGNGNLAISTKLSNIAITDEQISVVTSESNIVIKDKTVSVSAQNVMINGGNIALGKEATTPIVLSKLLTIAFNGHIHSNGNDGSPTGTPIVPITDEMIGSRTTIAQ